LPVEQSVIGLPLLLRIFAEWLYFAQMISFWSFAWRLREITRRRGRRPGRGRLFSACGIVTGRRRQVRDVSGPCRRAWSASSTTARRSRPAAIRLTMRQGNGA